MDVLKAKTASQEYDAKRSAVPVDQTVVKTPDFKEGGEEESKDDKK